MTSPHDTESNPVRSYDAEALLDAQYVWFYGPSTHRPEWFYDRTEFVDPRDLYEMLCSVIDIDYLDVLAEPFGWQCQLCHEQHSLSTPPRLPTWGDHAVVHELFKPPPTTSITTRPETSNKLQRNFQRTSVQRCDLRKQTKHPTA